MPKHAKTGHVPLRHTDQPSARHSSIYSAIPPRRFVFLPRAASLRFRSSPAVKRQPITASAFQFSLVRMHQLKLLSSSRSASAGKLTRTAPACASFLHVARSGSSLSVVPLAIFTTSHSHQMSTARLFRLSLPVGSLTGAQ